MDVQEIIRAFAYCETMPLDAIAEATARREELLPRFLEEMENLIAGDEVEAVGSPVFVIFHLMGSWHETRAYRTMARLLASDAEKIGMVFGDATTDTVHRVMANVCDGDPQPLYDAIESEWADEFVRNGLLKTLVMLVRQGKLERDAVLAYLRTTPWRLKPQHANMVWHGVQSAVALLGAADLAGTVKGLFDRGLVPPDILSYLDFRKDLESVIANPQRARIVREERLTPFGAIEKELATWSFGPDLSDLADFEDIDDLGSLTDEELEEKMAANRSRLASLQNGDAFAPAVPAVNPHRHVGRNDPCPCGSGKKFKKCHGQ